MSTFYYFYDIVYVLLCMVSCCSIVCAWLASRRNIYLVLASYSFCYLVEGAIVFFDEYLGDKNIWTLVGENAPLAHPVLRTIVSAGIIASCLSIALLLLDRLDKRVVLTSVLLFVVLQAFSFLAPTNDDQQLIFYSLRTLAIICCICFVLFYASREKDEVLRAYVFSYRRILFAVLALMVLVQIEDIRTIALGVNFIHNPDWVEFVSGRNIFEDVTSILVAVYTIIVAADVLTLRFKEPPASDAVSSARNLDVRFDKFCKHYDISVREQDILQEMIQGKTNRQIATDLFIAEGTVKAHVHSVYRKCNASCRKDILQMFWSE